MTLELRNKFWGKIIITNLIPLIITNSQTFLSHDENPEALTSLFNYFRGKGNEQLPSPLSIFLLYQDLPG